MLGCQDVSSVIQKTVKGRASRHRMYTFACIVHQLVLSCCTRSASVLHHCQSFPAPASVGAFSSFICHADTISHALWYSLLIYVHYWRRERWREMGRGFSASQSTRKSGSPLPQRSLGQIPGQRQQIWCNNIVPKKPPSMNRIAKCCVI